MDKQHDLPILAIVVPCYNEQETLPATNERLNALLAKMVDDGMVSPSSRLVYVDDGSRDNTWQLIESYCQEGNLVSGLKMAGNRGHQNALMAGIDTARDKLKASAIVTIDADLQDDPEAIIEMMKHFNEGADIVMGVRRNRSSDSWFKRTTAQWFYRLMRWMGVDVAYNHADYRLISRRVAFAMKRYPERNLFLRGVVKSMGFNQKSVYYDRTERLAGESKYPLGKMLNFAIDGITSFSVKPVRLVFTLGVIFMIIALGILIYVLHAKFTGHAVSGWSSMMLSLWFVGGCILLALGVVGEYIAKIYIEVKGRPRYHIDQWVHNA
ncbi:MAG: glycosyltransferase family 2 protein [Muribaculaceae bacterium]|nr:glycosyltransferase family 2 protein [Muribaculaceae bacterium]